MINLCPNEADPEESVREFVSNPEMVVLPGLRNQIKGLADCVEAELRRAEPDSEIVILDRDTMADASVSFPKELTSYLNVYLAKAKKVNVIVYEGLPVVGWQSVLSSLKGRDAEVYYLSLSCKFVPICVKMLRTRSYYLVPLAGQILHDAEDLVHHVVDGDVLIRPAGLVGVAVGHGHDPYAVLHDLGRDPQRSLRDRSQEVHDTALRLDGRPGGHMVQRPHRRYPVVVLPADHRYGPL